MAPVTQHADFQTRIRSALAVGNEALARVEKIKRFVILPRDFSQEAGELTPTMKVKRKAIETAYAEVFDRIYTDADCAHGAMTNRSGRDAGNAATPPSQAAALRSAVCARGHGPSSAAQGPRPRMRLFVNAQLTSVCKPFPISIT